MPRLLSGAKKRRPKQKANLTPYVFLPLNAQAHAQLRPARAFGRGQQGERAVSSVRVERKAPRGWRGAEDVCVAPYDAATRKNVDLEEGG